MIKIVTPVAETEEYEYEEEPNSDEQCTYDEILAFPNAKFLQALNNFEAVLDTQSNIDKDEGTYRKRFFILLKGTGFKIVSWLNQNIKKNGKIKNNDKYF